MVCSIIGEIPGFKIIIKEILNNLIYYIVMDIVIVKKEHNQRCESTSLDGELVLKWSVFMVMMHIFCCFF